MWMVGYNEGGGDHHHHHQLNMVVDHPLFNGRNNSNNNKLRPLIPMPMTSSPNYTSTTANPIPCLSRSNVQGNNFFSHYHHHHHHHLLVGEENKSNSGIITPVVVSSSRWNPTPDQVRALEELYRRGTRTPSAEQIQNITAELRRFGKIEGKNVFYWFQNHKARERQKRRRQMESSSSSSSASALNAHHHHRGNNNYHRDFDPLENKETAANRTLHEVEQTKNWTLSTNCTTLAEESVSIERAAKAGFAECRPDGWLQFDESSESELQQSRNFIERNATWHMLVQSPCPVTNLINTTLPLPSVTAAAAATTNAAAAIMAETKMDPNLIKNHDLSLFISTQSEGDHVNNNNNFVESQTTLQLFPLRSGDDDHVDVDDDNNNNKETEISASEVNANNLTPNQFFEFLPLKN